MNFYCFKLSKGFLELKARPNPPLFFGSKRDGWEDALSI